MTHNATQSSIDYSKSSKSKSSNSKSSIDFFLNCGPCFFSMQKKQCLVLN